MVTLQVLGSIVFGFLGILGLTAPDRDVECELVAIVFILIAIMFATLAAHNLGFIK